MSDKWDDDGHRRGEFGKAAEDDGLSTVQRLELRLEQLKAQQPTPAPKDDLPPPKGVVQAVNTGVFEKNTRQIALIEKQLEHERKFSDVEPEIPGNDIDPSDND